MNPMSFRMPRLLALALGMCLAASAAAQGARTVAPERLPGYWILLNTKVDADVPNTGLNLDKPGCVAVSYVIGSDGVPRNIQVRKVVPKSDFGKIATSVVANFRYGPSLTNRDGEPVSTYYVIPFNAPDDPAQRQQLMAPCQLPGYAS